jgi:hypothetical protein
MFTVAKDYESDLSAKEEDFWKNYDATNPRLSEDERYKLAMKLTKGNTTQASQPSYVPVAPQPELQYTPPAPVSNPIVDTTADRESKLKSLAFNPLKK